MPPPVPKPMVDTPALRALCEMLAPGEIPMRVAVDTPPYAIPRECTQNVDAVIENLGGSSEYGWQLWETLPGVLLEAQFHAVWVGDDGRRFDVTPPELAGVRHTVFLRDPALEYGGQQIDNVRVALVDDPIVLEFIEAAKRFFELTNEGQLAGYHGELTLMPDMKAALARQQSLGLQIVSKYYA